MPLSLRGAIEAVRRANDALDHRRRGGRVTVHLDRDSVHMSDDVGRIDAVDGSRNTTLDQVLRDDYHLASFQGGQGCWLILRGDREGAPLGVWAQQWQHTRLLAPHGETTDSIGALAGDGIEELWLYFGSLGQLDPDEVFELLAGGVTDREGVYTACVARRTAERIAAEKLRAASVAERLLPADAITALERVGATIHVHSDAALYASAADRDYEIRVAESTVHGQGARMLSVRCPYPALGMDVAHWAFGLSHPEDAARMLLGRIGEHARERAGLEPYAWPETPPLGDEPWSRDALTTWTSHGSERRGDFRYGVRALPEPFARTALLSLETIAAAYSEDGGR